MKVHTHVCCHVVQSCAQLYECANVCYINIDGHFQMHNDTHIFKYVYMFHHRQHRHGKTGAPANETNAAKWAITILLSLSQASDSAIRLLDHTTQPATSSGIINTRTRWKMMMTVPAEAIDKFWLITLWAASCHSGANVEAATRGPAGRLQCGSSLGNEGSNLRPVVHRVALLLLPMYAKLCFVLRTCSDCDWGSLTKLGTTRVVADFYQLDCCQLLIWHTTLPRVNLASGKLVTARVVAVF